ncbi:MAG: hypothetical protein U0R70_04225 [Solirubrobacteraceae bacterium]
MSGAASGSVAPLVIAPSDDPAVERLDLGGGPADVFFVQRMPATKVVTTVTLGDFAKDPACEQAAPLRLYVREAPSGDLWDDHSQIAYSPQMVPPPEEPGRMTFQIAPTTLRAGRGYIFRLGWEGGCRFVRQTTWAHNAPTVNPGPSSCTGPPEIAGGIYGGPSYRMYHQQGLDDRQPACLNDASDPVRFHPSMPTGWMVTQGALPWSVSAKAGERHDVSQPLCLDDNIFNLGVRDAGVAEAPWFWPDPPANFLCQWTGYAGPPGTTVPDGWYYALPWTRQRFGAPRDGYLKLETIDYQAELQQHVPALFYSEGEEFRSLHAQAFVEHWKPDAQGQWDADHANTLKTPVVEPTQATIAKAGAPSDFRIDGLPVWRLTLANLGPQYPVTDPQHSDGAAKPQDYIDADGGSAAVYREADALERTGGLGTTVFGRATHNSAGVLFLQYWIFYYYNRYEAFINDLHEGDWELVQLELGADGNPSRVEYARHDYSSRCQWNEVDHYTPLRPKVYVALGSHASYGTAGTTGIHGTPVDDEHFGNSTINDLDPTVIPIDDDGPAWLRWPGFWGASANVSTPPDFPSPRSPAMQPNWDPDHLSGACE